MNQHSGLDIRDIYDISHDIHHHQGCTSCESCLLRKYSDETPAWFVPLSFAQKKNFLHTLLLMTENFQDIFRSTIKEIVQSKDFEYKNLRMKNLKKNSFFEDRTNHSLDIHQVSKLMREYINWFQMASDWTRRNYLYMIMCLCSNELLATLLSMCEKEITNSDSEEDEVIYSQFKDAVVPIEHSEAPFQHKSLLKTIKSPLQNKRVSSAKDHVSFTNDSIHSFRMASRASAASVRSISSSARCTPLIPNGTYTPLSMSTMNSKIFTKTMYHRREYIKIDFIAKLPVHIAKKILGYLDEATLRISTKVNLQWELLSKEVISEIMILQIAREDVMVMQAGSGKIPNPHYARRVPVHIPRVDVKGNVVYNRESSNVDVEIVHNEFADINLESYFEEVETREVMMEERNVFCGSYNIFIAEPHKDVHRSVSYSNGNHVAIGSVDRKIHIYDVNSGDCLSVISGHTASIRCLHVNENHRFVISGSYDLTVRVWSLVSGKCKHLFRGHKGTIMYVTSSMDYVFSSSTDKTVKVWNLTSGRCKRTLHHQTPVRYIEVKDVVMVTGCVDGDIFMWNILESKNLRKLQGHTNIVTGICLDAYHLVTCSCDGNVLLWDNVGKLDKPLITYRHPKGVFSVNVSFCRIISGCADGKVRIWNMLNGECLRVIRGNSKNDAILDLFIAENRFVINTLSCVLVYNFEPMKYDYSAPRDRESMNSKTKLNLRRYKLPHASTRAEKVNIHGSPIHKEGSSNKFSLDSENILRVQSAPNKIDYRRVMSRTSSSFRDHVQRVQSAHAPSEYLLSKQNANTKSRPELLSGIKDFKNLFSNDFQFRSKNTPMSRRCQSAPITRSKKELIKTSSFVFNDPVPNKMIPKVVNKMNKRKCQNGMTTTDSQFEDLTIRSYYKQLEYEEILRKS